MNCLFKIMTLKEAASKWGLADSTLRMLMKSDKVKEGVDCRKSGSTWLITYDSMCRIYGEPKK